MAMAFNPPRRFPSFVRLAVIALFVISVIYYVRNTNPTRGLGSQYLPDSIHWPKTPYSHEQPLIPGDVHPIDTLISNAEDIMEAQLKKETKDVKSAAAAYRTRRGRHPPPGFDAWFKYAQERDAIIVEDFFDQIYHDLAPYWGIAAASLRREAREDGMKISIRNGVAEASSSWFWTEIWHNLTATIEHLLPDMDIPLNPMDEPRIVAPWEDINKYMQIEKKTRFLHPKKQVIERFQKLPPPNVGDEDVKPRDVKWQTDGSYWEIAVRGCPPDSLARNAARITDFSQTPNITMGLAAPHLYRGFVSNYSLSTEFCHQPDLQGLHGALIQPLSISSTNTLIPLFGGSKLPTNNEILLPAPMYWANEERFSGGDDHGIPWIEKLNRVIWRGVATGGKNKESNWRGFQRHRFVSMVNSTKVSRAESRQEAPENWALPSSQYNLAAQEDGKLGRWIDTWADAGFVDLNCEENEPNGTCYYTDPYFSLVQGLRMADQFSNKYLPDIDGNSFSGRYRGFLMSTSLPIKATIFKEWHDSRLIAWKHFVPMDNRFMDFYGIMEYFFGYDGLGEQVVGGNSQRRIKGRDKAAEKIAMEGQEWAMKVLRPEDMQIYVLRLLLEYARISDDKREMLGYVADLK